MNHIAGKRDCHYYKAQKKILYINAKQLPDEYQTCKIVV